MTTDPPTPAPPPERLRERAVVRCRGLRLERGGSTVLDGLDLTVEPGRVHALLGRNGAGKSTTFRMLLGLLRPDSGTVEVLGADPADRVGRGVLARVGASIDGPAVYDHLSAFDNLLVHARLTGTSRGRIEEVLDVVGLAGTGRKRARTFSTGMRGRLALGVAILTRPELLVLDEPQNGLDPQGIVELRTLLRAYAAEGRTVLVSSHQLGEVVRLADDISVLGGGRCLYRGPLARFAPPERLEQAFLDLTLPTGTRVGAP
ncbi:ATP-binding cassette domain-containing protein [Nocardiopsis sp. NPDC007018]|uniref:ATP-binding cassette domain-containing protein n=1 Tax=Nocardiopsis sp. NPDC007018 TaxID=3155721 RepID=UPI0033DF1ED9